MKEIKAADQTFAILGAILWSIQVIPQVVKSYREKSTFGLSPILMFVWGWATIFQGSYLVSQRSSIALQIQPQVFGFLCVVSWGQCLHYGSKYSVKKTLLCMSAFYVVFVGFEVGSVYALWAGQRHGVTWPGQMYGWITSVLLALGLLPEYYEIYKHKEVVGLSLLFMAVDISGGVFSGISLFFRDEFDVAAFVQYMLVVLLDGIIVILALILNPIAKRRRAREAKSLDAENQAGREGDEEPQVRNAPSDGLPHPSDDNNTLDGTVEGSVDGTVSFLDSKSPAFAGADDGPNGSPRQSKRAEQPLDRRTATMASDSRTVVDELGYEIDK